MPETALCEHSTNTTLSSAAAFAVDAVIQCRSSVERRKMLAGYLKRIRGNAGWLRTTP